MEISKYTTVNKVWLFTVMENRWAVRVWGNSDEWS